MQNETRLAELERQLADAHTRITEMVRETDQRDELISDLQRRIEELEQAGNRACSSSEL